MKKEHLISKDKKCCRRVKQLVPLNCDVVIDPLEGLKGELSIIMKFSCMHIKDNC